MAMRLLCEYPGGYNGTRPGLRGAWPAGEARVTSDENADYLLKTFPAYFRPVGEPGPTMAAPAPPQQDRMVRSAAHHPSVPPGVLDLTVAELRPMIEAGTCDAYLGPLRERAARRTIIAAIDRRARLLASG